MYLTIDLRMEDNSYKIKTLNQMADRFLEFAQRFRLEDNNKVVSLLSRLSDKIENSNLESASEDEIQEILTYSFNTFEKVEEIIDSINKQ